MNKLDACKDNYRQLVICYKKHKYLTTNILIGLGTVTNRKRCQSEQSYLVVNPLCKQNSSYESLQNKRPFQ